MVQKTVSRADSRVDDALVHRFQNTCSLNNPGLLHLFLARNASAVYLMRRLHQHIVSVLATCVWASHHCLNQDEASEFYSL